MSYDNYRQQLIRTFYRSQIARFVGRFNPKRRTVILLPGGMGSELSRTFWPYPTGNPSGGFWDTVWMDLGVAFTSDLIKLEIVKSEVDGSLQDLDSFVIGATGPFKFLSQKPYAQFAEHIETENRWNLLVFPYDWRRSLAESTGHFKWFVTELRRQVGADYQFDPLPNASIVCHSMGGMVATLALQDPTFGALPFRAIVTVATPFYGTSTHQQRYYVGQDPLNSLVSPTHVTRVIASFPGPYSLMFLPKAIYDRDGAAIGLQRYPVRDRRSLDREVDPFGAAARPRWPRYVKLDYMQENMAALDAMTRPLAAEVKKKYFNVRSVLDRETAIELLWEEIDGVEFNPEIHMSPLAEVIGPGDGTVPYWSAFHADSVHRHDLKQASDHGLLFQHQEVLDVIDAVVDTGKLPTKAPRAAPKAEPMASRAVANRAYAAAASATMLGRIPPGALFEEGIQQAVVSDLLSFHPPEDRIEQLPARTAGTPTPSATALASATTKKARRRDIV